MIGKKCKLTFSSNKIVGTPGSSHNEVTKSKLHSLNKKSGKSHSKNYYRRLPILKLCLKVKLKSALFLTIFGGQ